jgi:hypothetical protein
MIETSPFHTVKDLLDRFGSRALLVRVLNPQDKFSLVPARV